MAAEVWCHHRSVPADASNADPGSSALHLDADDVAGARRRLRLDWRTFAYLVGAILAALAILAVFRTASTMITRIGIGLLIALALDPVADAVQRRFHTGRGVAVAVVATGVLGLTALLMLVLGPKAVDQAQQFQDELPDTLAEMERLPLVGERLRDADVAGRIEEWIERLPEQVTDARVAETAGTLVSGVASVAIVAVFAIAVLIDGEHFVGQVRRLLPARRQQQGDEIGRVMYDTIGRYFGGSVTVALLMGLFVLTLGLILGIPLAPLAAVWAMLTDLIPQVGGLLGGAFFVLLALTQSVPTALIAGAGFVLYMNLENHVIQPAIVGKSVDLTPPTTMIAAFVGAAVAGVPGALVATPLVGTVKAIYLEARGVERPDHARGGLGATVAKKVKSLLQRPG